MVGFDYRGLPCINGYFEKYRISGCWLRCRLWLRLSRLALDLVVISGACIALMGISISSELAAVGSAVVVGFDYRGLPYINGYF